MSAKTKAIDNPVFLGIECGGTRTVALLADAAGHLLKRIERNGLANLRLMSPAQLKTLLRGIAAELPPPAAVGIGMAGVVEEAERRQLREAAHQVWPRVPCWAGNDLETALAAAKQTAPQPNKPCVVIISGTGASCFGRRPESAPVLTAGWGHLLGDRGSGYDLALRGLQTAFEEYDQAGRWPSLGQRFLRALQLNSPNELITWAHAASKTDISAIAVEVFAAAAAGDRFATRILRSSGDALARSAAACARRLVRRGAPFEFVLTGSVLLKQPAFARHVRRRLLARWPGATTRTLTVEAAWGAVHLAREQWQSVTKSAAGAVSPATESHPDKPTAASLYPVPVSLGLPPTEERNPRSKHLDRLPLRTAIHLMLDEEAGVPTALRREAKTIERIVRILVNSFRRGGRLFYVGAGTSGRLGMLDASECPPTFNLPPDTVQAILAGGQQALLGSFETAEDDAEAGAEAVRCRGIRKGDVIVGIAASGQTPFVWGALQQARRVEATSILVCFNPKLALNGKLRPTVVLSPRIGPEVLTGSTRLKAGTATKLLLNLFSTLSMVRLGKVVQNLMVDVQPSNAKLRQRAIRIVQELSGASPSVATEALEKNRWSVKRALKTTGLKSRVNRQGS